MYKYSLKVLGFSVIFLTLILTAVHSQNGIIRSLTGDVELKPAGASAFTRASVGSQVAGNTIVSTGFGSTALIEVGSTQIFVRPLTRLTLQEIQSTSGIENLNVNLQAGRIRVEVNPPAGTRATATVRSPSATASVLGTVFEIDTQNLEVIEGSVVYTGTSGFTFTVTEGNVSRIDILGSAEDPVSLTSNEILPSGPVGAGMSGEAQAQDTINGTISGGSVDITVNFR